MKSRSVADKPKLTLLLAVKGQADNLDLLRPVKLFTDAQIEIINPRSISELHQALASPGWDLAVCDHLLLNRRTLPRLSRLREHSTRPPLVTFAHETDAAQLKQARDLKTLHTFVINELDPAGLHNLVHMSLKYALLCKDQAQSDHPLFRRLTDSYGYQARIDDNGNMRSDWVSPGFESVTGYTPAEINEKGGWIACVHPDDLPIIKRFSETLADNKPGSAIYRATAKNGATLYLESTGEPLWDEGGQCVVGVVGFTRDITERERLRHSARILERQQGAMVRLGELAAQQPSLEELLKQTALIVTQTLEAWICEIFLVDDKLTRGTLEAATGLESKLIGTFELPLGRNNELSYVFESGEAVSSPDLRREKRFRPSAHLRRNKALAGICAPIRCGENTRGMLAVYANRPAAYTADNQRFVESAAAMVAALAGRSPDESTLRHTREALVEQTRRPDDEHTPLPAASGGASENEDDISVIVKTAKELRNRNVILSAVSHATGMLIDANDWQTAMNDVLAELGRAANASRAYVFRNDDAEGRRSSLIFEWVNKGIEPCIERAEYRGMSLKRAGIERFADVLKRGGVIVGPVEEFTESEQAYFGKMQVISTAIVPIFVEERWWGFLGLDACNHHRNWSTAEVDALNIAANTLSTALARQQNEVALHAIQAGTVSKTGEDYFRSLLHHLAGVFDADYCLLAEATGPNQFRVGHALHKGELLPPFEYRQKASTFDNADSEQIVQYSEKVYEIFPENAWLQEQRIEGYLAIPVLDNNKQVLGHIAVMSTQPLRANSRELQILEIFAARVGVELERQRMETENLQLARISLENPNMVMIADLEGRILFTNPACSRIMEKLNLSGTEKLLPDNHAELIEQTQESSDQVVTVERAIAGNHFQWNYYLQSDLNRIHIYAIDMTQSRLMEEQLRRDAFHDPLTGLPNRNFFNNLLDHAIERTRRRDDYAFAVLYLDLDRFKYINDSLGHAHGDKFLETVAGVLKGCLRPGDYIARLGGDEFAILLDAVPDTQEAANIANRIQQTLSQPIVLNQHEAFTSASIGIALSTRGYDNPQNILRDADIAMYSAKQTGKARYAVFDTRMHDEMVHVMRLEVDLRHALQNGELSVYYQPIYSIPDKRLVGLEALVRWNHPERGFLEPDDFIPLAEEMAIIREIDYLVMNNSARQLKTWRRKFEAARNIKMHVNLSGIHFNNTAILAEIGNVLKDNSLSNDSLQLELTESILMDNTNRSTEIFSVLTKLGVHISIDDFGVGYSSLSRLTKLPVNMLKIDRGFVQSMMADSTSLNITRAVIDLAHDLNMEVIAEGVESSREYQILGRMGCQYAQGFYISKPLTARQAERFLTNPPELE